MGEYSFRMTDLLKNLKAVYRADLYTQSRTKSWTLWVRSSVLDGNDKRMSFYKKKKKKKDVPDLDL